MKRGFTVVELVIVVTISMILVGMLMPALTASRKAADRIGSDTCARHA